MLGSSGKKGFLHLEKGEKNPGKMWRDFRDDARNEDYIRRCLLEEIPRKKYKSMGGGGKDLAWGRGEPNEKSGVSTVWKKKASGVQKKG